MGGIYRESEGRILKRYYIVFSMKGTSQKFHMELYGIKGVLEGWNVVDIVQNDAETINKMVNGADTTDGTSGRPVS